MCHKFRFCARAHEQLNSWGQNYSLDVLLLLLLLFFLHLQYANRIADLLEDVSNGNQVVATEASHIMEDSTKPRRQSTVAAWVNVIYGCNERCAFCIVPTTRGVEQSRPMDSILQEVEELVSQGYQEVTLLGQNIE